MARRRRNRNVFRGEPDGLQPGDSVGNRKPKQAQRLPPDDIGNRKSDEPGARLPPDDIGNRIDSMPTHELSGVLMELDARKGRRNKKRNGRGETVRMGRYVLGGVNPLVAGDTQRAQKAQDEAHEKQKADRREDRAKRKSESGGGGGGGGPSDDDGGRRSDRRRQRFFDFVDDDRYDYQLQSDPEEKRALAEETVQEIVTRAGRAAACVAHVIEDGSRPKVLVTIDEWGPTGTVKNGKPEGPQLFGLGAAALMSLNYLVNKIVNRFPKDRIRLAVLPQSEEAAYRESLAEHRAAHPDDKAPAQGDKGEKKPQKAKKADAADDVPAASGAGDKPAKVKKVRASKKASSDEPAAAAATADAEGAADEAPAKKATKKKATAKKATAKKAPAKKATAKKAPAKKAAAKKAPAKKATAKKAPAKKATAKKATAKKATKKKTSADE